MTEKPLIRHKAYSQKYLESISITKRDLYQMMEVSNNVTSDYALPQPWLDDFVKRTKLDYDLVLSTTFYAYPDHSIISFGFPISGCIEVNQRINNWFADRPIRVEEIKYVKPKIMGKEKINLALHVLNVTEIYINALEAKLIEKKIPLPKLPVETTSIDPIALVKDAINKLTNK